MHRCQHQYFLLSPYLHCVKIFVWNINEYRGTMDKNTGLIQILILPPANVVWGKVIFSEACVKNSVHGEGGGNPACITGGIPACLAGLQAHAQGGS